MFEQDTHTNMVFEFNRAMPLHSTAMLSAYIHKYQRQLKAASDQCGKISGATYVLRCKAVGDLFSLMLNLRSQGKTTNAAIIQRKLHSVVNELRQQFRDMSGPLNPRKGKRIVEYQADGGPLYVFQPRLDRGLNNPYTEQLRFKLTKDTAQQIAPLQFHTYVIDKDGCCFIYQQPLKLPELVTGMFYKGYPMKHPGLLSEGELAVQAAGDLLLVKNDDNQLLGVFTTRASGHFRPGPEIDVNIRKMVQTQLGLKGTVDTLTI